MASPHPDQPQQGTGLPPGVELGPLGPRLVSYLIDSVLPGVLGALMLFALPGLSGAARSVLTVITVALLVGWLLLVWRMTAVQAASPGMRLMKLQLVGFYDGRPVGWARAFVRGLVLGLLNLSGVGVILLVVFLLLHPRRQGWHDLAAEAVVIKARGLAPVQRSRSASAAVSPPQDRSDEPQPAGVLDEEPQGSVGHHSSTYGVVGPQTPAPDHPAPDHPAPHHAASDHPAPDHPAPDHAASDHAAPPAPPSGSLAQPAVSAPPAAPDIQPGPTPDAAPEAAWIAELDDGREIVIEGLLLLGRNPQPQPGEEGAQLIKLADETRTVSKSHLAIGLDSAGLFVVDRGSTNGSTVTTPVGVSSRARAGEIVYVEEESVVSIGDHWLRIRRDPR